MLAYFINDAEPMPSYSDTGWIATHSAAWVVAGYRFDSLFRQFGEAPDWKRYYRISMSPRPGWLQTRTARRLRCDGPRLGAMLIVFTPRLAAQPYPFHRHHGQVRPS